jgi:hypothetical protein
MSHETLTRLLAILGAVLQLVGFAGAVLSASTARYEEYGDAGFLRRGWVRFVRWFGPPPEPVYLEASSSASAGMTGDLTVGKPLESDIERLDRELRELRGAFERHRDETTTRLMGLQADLREHADESARRFQEIQERQDRIHLRGLQREVRASLLFLAGTALTILSYVV